MLTCSRWCLLAVLGLGGCKGGEAAETGAGPTSGGAASESTATPTGSDSGMNSVSGAETGSETGTGASSGGSGDPSGPTTAATSVAETGTDTGPPGLACPLADEAGVMHAALMPALFGEGADPADAAVCEILNPERGFHHYTDLRTLDADTLDEATAAGRTVIYGQVLIPEYRDKPLDAKLLGEVTAGFDLARSRGIKVVPRFHYSDDIGEPDATLDRILGHIEQLKPLLQAHADVILTLHAGFIGAYGEWHSSQHGLDMPGPRKQILDALLAALPASRTIGVRRPSFKQEAYAGPLTEATAYDGSALARITHINDCFLASEDDEGTYQEPGEKAYMIADSPFGAVGGETCKVNPPRSECPAALAELALLHWTHLNSAYHPDVLADWQQGGCYGEVACRLGYRLAVKDLRWGASAAPGGSVPVSFDLYNDGFAAPANERPLMLVLDGPIRLEVALGLDARRLAAGATSTVCVDAPLPGDLPAGQYRIGLRLADAAPGLADDPRFAIRLANDTGVEWTAGINFFAAMVTVE